MYNNNNPSVNLSYPVTTAAMYSQGDSFNTLKYNQVDAYANMQDPMEPTDLSYSNTFGCSGASATTATYSTPTTASNFEPPYVDMQPIIDGNTMASQQSGFVPPLVEPQGYGSYDNKAWMSQPVDNHRNITMVRPGLAMSQIRGSFIGRRHRDEVNPEEEHRKRVRRERNKLAAARCRQRRTDLTNKLQDETDELHDEQHQLEDEIEKLRQQKEQLEFVLKAHKSSCKAPDAIRCQPLPQPRPAALLKKEPQNNDIVVKTEPKSGDEYDTMSPGSSCSSNMSVTSSHTLPSTGSMVHSTIARPHTLDIPARSLPSNSKTETVTTTTTAESKSNMAVTPGVFTLGFEAMMDGSTGLTPITGSTGLTPIMSAPSCASQVQRSSSDSSSSENNLASPTLMAL